MGKAGVLTKPTLRSDSEAWQMVTDNMDTIRKIVHKVSRDLRLRPATEEDMIQEAQLGAFRAAQRFDPAFRVLFTTFVRRYITLYIFRAVTRDGFVEKPKKCRPSVKPFEKLMEDAQGVEDTSLDLEMATMDRERIRIIKEVVERFPRRLRIIFVRRFIEGKTCLQVAKKLGLTKQRVHRLGVQALAQLSETLYRQKVVSTRLSGKAVARLCVAGVV